MIGMGYRTIKTAIGAGLAIWIASLFDLEFASFAAIIVIMCIEKTKKKTLHSIQKKFFASLLSLILGSIFFELLGYHPITLTLFILFFVPVLVKTRTQEGFITSIVVVLHIYTVKEANLENLLNELYIIFIGIGIALLVNSIMPSFKKEIEQYKKDIENKFSTILYQFSTFLKDSEQEWDGKEIVEVENILNQAKNLTIQDVENHLLRKENKDYYYLEMREDQLEILKQMVAIIGIVSSSKLEVKQRGMLASIFLNISQHVDSGDTTIALKLLEEYEESIRETELPKTREEFEIRANLFYLNFEIKNYLIIKKNIFNRTNV
ncbi:aromatic acid exporter family protein [Sporosarcina thermotolerans]|uniref:Aromatic acid exporter family protein n=1 Tax=Sporosarcina thermotolerans TaxID=633404 RepID=A0AAW9A6B6_9BACL|nr:aromatic acid exporter family protein [Sporosarcina thermotolerans]MDW0116514.1 aromatic acid exporter family protein [Sporosarcina thermotolerans]WHT48742.1 aromatic acid exporter family protein [Sporosarcina thermotolerans]